MVGFNRGSLATGGQTQSGATPRIAMAWAVNSASLMPVDAIAAAGDVLLLCGFLSAELSKAMGQSLKMRRCKLIPLPADNPDTTVDESKTQCEDISKCFW